MSCVYWPPKSRTAILSVASTGPSLGLSRAAELLSLLEDLSFRLDRWSDDELGQLELADVPGPHRAHAGSDGAHEIQGAVFRECRSEEDLLERARDTHADPRSA